MTPDIGMQSMLFMTWSSENAVTLRPHAARYGGQRDWEPEASDKAFSIGRPQLGFGLLRGVQDLW
jgi:hypothetical protein